MSDSSTASPTDEPTPARAPAMGPVEAAALVFGSSAAVLVVELLALRLLAPYLGLTLEMNTIVIGVALAAIAVGSWAGGWAADRVDPRRTLGPLLLLSGALVLLIVPAVRWTGESSRGGDVSGVLLMAAATVFVPAALLSAVTPMVTKLRLSSLDETGAVVGRLSGIGTVGALTATVVTGFVLVSHVPGSVTMFVLGAVLVAVGLALAVRLRGWRPAAGPLAVALVAVAATVWGPQPCQVETVYHCASIVDDDERPGGRALVLDTLRHSYVDLSDPTYLEFEYIRSMASAVDAAWPAEETLSAFHLGAGALTLPRYLDHERPGTRSLVAEVDPGVLGLVRDELPFDEVEGRDAPGIRAVVDDARLALADEADDSRDLVVSDAFGGIAVPWHLATAELMRDVRRVLTDDGVYLLNVIDQPPLSLARSQVATLSEVFAHVRVASWPATLAGDDGGNLVLLASDREPDMEAWSAAMEARDTGWEVLDAEQTAAFAGDAPVLGDDYAPVDQLLTPYRTE